jgi:hypothetical protein
MLPPVQTAPFESETARFGNPRSIQAHTIML